MSDSSLVDFIALSNIIDQEQEFIPLISEEEEDHLNN